MIIHTSTFPIALIRKMMVYKVSLDAFMNMSTSVAGLASWVRLGVLAIDHEVPRVAVVVLVKFKTSLYEDGFIFSTRYSVLYYKCLQELSSSTIDHLKLKWKGKNNVNYLNENTFCKDTASITTILNAHYLKYIYKVYNKEYRLFWINSTEEFNSTFNKFVLFNHCIAVKGTMKMNINATTKNRQTTDGLKV